MEATYASPSKTLAGQVQARIFKHAYHIAVMSEGMRDLYKRKYGIESTAWEHIYPEEPVRVPAAKENRAHWSGDVYEINHKAVVIRTVLLTATAGLNGDKRRNATVIRLISSLLEDFIFCLWLVRF